MGRMIVESDDHLDFVMLGGLSKKVRDTKLFEQPLDNRVVMEHIRIR